MRYLLLLSAILLCSCGYQFQGGGSVLPPDVQKVSIPVAENLTSQPGVSLQLTEALRDRFERFGVLSVVDKTSQADAVLTAKILEINEEARTVTAQTEQALQFQTTMKIAAELRRTSGPVLWRNPNLLVSQDYGSTSDVVVTSSADFAASATSTATLEQLDNREVSRGQERQTLEQLSEDAARKIYNEAVAPDF